jgi:hypothetical protein
MVLRKIGITNDKIGVLIPLVPEPVAFNLWVPGLRLG